MTLSALSWGLMLVAMGLALLSLAIGLITFGKKPVDAGLKSQFWMRWRVFFQGAALVFFLSAMWLA